MLQIFFVFFCSRLSIYFGLQLQVWKHCVFSEWALFPGTVCRKMALRVSSRSFNNGYRSLRFLLSLRHCCCSYRRLLNKKKRTAQSMEILTSRVESWIIITTTLHYNAVFGQRIQVFLLYALITSRRLWPYLAMLYHRLKIVVLLTALYSFICLCAFVRTFWRWFLSYTKLERYASETCSINMF